MDRIDRHGSGISVADGAAPSQPGEPSAVAPNDAAAEVLFLDDNQLNVEAAKRVGMKAVQVRGVTEAERVLVDVGVMEI